MNEIFLKKIRKKLFFEMKAKDAQYRCDEAPVDVGVLIQIHNRWVLMNGN